MAKSTISGNTGKIEFEEDVPLEKLQAPTYSEKLHPREQEEASHNDLDLDELIDVVRSSEAGEWDRFRASVGLEPNKPLEVTPTGNGKYKIVDGDRRYHAVKQNGADSVSCFIVQEEGDELSDIERSLRMITANEARKESDPIQRAIHLAKLSAPWFLEPPERIVPLEDMNNSDPDQIPIKQSNLADRLGVSQKTVSNWISGPLGASRPFRGALKQFAARDRPDPKQIKEIDEIMRNFNGDGDNPPINDNPRMEKRFVTDLESLSGRGISLCELRNVAEKASENNWGLRKYIDYLEENYAYDDDEDDIEVSVIGDDSMSADDVTSESDWGQATDPLENESTQPTGTLGENIEAPEAEVEWEQFENLDLGGKSVSEITQKQILNIDVENDFAIAIQMMAHATGKTRREVVNQFVAPVVVDATIETLADLQT